MTRPHDKINKLAARIQKALREFGDNQSHEEPTLTSIRAELEQIQNEFHGFDFNLNPATVSVIMGPVTLEDIYLGSFRVQLDISRISSLEPADCFDVIALEPHPSPDNPSVTHPHVSGQKLCTGNATAPLSEARRTGRLCDFFLLIRSVLDTYNPDSPFVPLGNWECQYDICYDCGARVPQDESRKCPLCSRLFCENCINTFPCCEMQICSLCLKDVKYVNQDKCKNCSQKNLGIPNLIQAVKAQCTFLVELMIAAGADMDEQDHALTYANRLENPEIENLLRQNGAREPIPKPDIESYLRETTENVDNGRYNSEPNENAFMEQSFGDILSEASEMALWDDEEIKHKDHGNTHGYLVYYGNESIHLSELLYPS